MVNTSLDTEVAVIGAGPYGLSLASHLKAAGVSYEIFGDPMSYWRDHMPRGMMLRSSWDASHIASPAHDLKLEAYQAERGRPVQRPIPLDDFVGYGAWFQEKIAPHLLNQRVECVEPSQSSYLVTLDDGRRLTAKRVVVATGLRSFERVPAAFAALTRRQCIHAANLREPTSMTGQKVAVIGGGQSALETTALLKEAGAEVEVLVRQKQVRWLQRSLKLHSKEGMARRLLYPPTDVGPPVLNQIVARPNLWKTLPRTVGAKVAYRSIRPAAAGWLVPRLKDVRISLDSEVVSSDGTDGMVRLRLSGGGEREVNAVVLATGYRIDATSYPFISRDLLRGLKAVDGYPVLTRGFQSSVVGLHFVGAVGAYSFGPLMRFVSGTSFTSRAVTAALARGVD